MCHQVVFRVTVVLCMHIMHAASRQRASAGRLILSFCMILHSALQSTKQFPTMIRTTTFVLLGLLAAVAGAFVPSAGPSFGKSLLRVSEFVGLVGHRCGFAARCF